MPPNAALEVAATPRTWVFPVLTLDVVRPFYDMMGLQPGDPNAFQRVLRDVTVATRKQVERTAAGSGPPPTLTDFSKHLADGIGQAATANLVWWLENVFHGEPRDNLSLRDWTHVLRHCRRESVQWLRLRFPKDLSEEALRRFRVAIDITEFHRRKEEVDAHPLSDWDLHMYASQLYVFDDELAGGGPDPFVDVKATIRDYQGYAFWAWVLRTLRPDQLMELREGALGIVTSEDLTSVKELVDPAQLGIGYE